jgi:hypothetical protein
MQKEYYFRRWCLKQLACIKKTEYAYRLAAKTRR